MKALRKSTVLCMADRSSVSSHSRTSTVFFLRLSLICSFMFLTTVSHIFSQLFLSGVIRLGGIATDCSSKEVFLLVLLSFSGDQMRSSACIVEVLLMIYNKFDWEDRKYDLSFENVTKNNKYAEHRQLSFEHWMNSFSRAAFGAVFAHQLIHMFTFQTNGKKITERISINLSRTIRPTQFSISLFGAKVSLDFICEKLKLWRMTQYQKGGISGLISYIINRPLDQIEAARAIILRDQKKKIGRLQGLKIVLMHDGFKGLYKHENILAPLSAYINRSIYFGLYFRLLISYNMEGAEEIFKFLIYPLISSIGAGSSTFILDKIRSSYIYVHQLRNSSLVRRSKKNLSESNSVSRELFQLFVQGKIGINRSDFSSLLRSCLKNWILLSFFMVIQSYPPNSSKINDPQ